MSKLAQNVAKTVGNATGSTQKTRQHASNQEHSKTKQVVSYRLTTEAKSRIEEMRLRKGSKTGRIPSATEVLEEIISDASETYYT